MNPQAVFSSAYFPPVQYFSKLSHLESILLEVEEHYEKQSYRTRTNILGANGILTLSIPVIHSGNERRPIKDVKISYNDNWQKIHWRSIESAYRRSPFFEYYEDFLRTLYEKKETFLLDFNIKTLEVTLKVTGIKLLIHKTEEFLKEVNLPDYRYNIHPKVDFSTDKSFQPVFYQQVFTEKFDFVPNLSILDLIFNQGPAGKEILFRSHCQ